MTGNGGPFRSFTFEALITARPDLRHTRTRVQTPGQNRSRERGFGTMKHEWLFREEIDHGLELVDQINAYRRNYNHARPHEHSPGTGPPRSTGTPCTRRSGLIVSSTA